MTAIQSHPIVALVVRVSTWRDDRLVGEGQTWRVCLLEARST